MDVEKNYWHYKKFWDEFSSLPDYEKEAIRQAWFNYYFVEMPKTRAYLRFQKIKGLLKEREIRFSLVREFARKAREQRENQDWELTKPYKFDPEFVWYKLSYYAGLVKALEKKREREEKKQKKNERRNAFLD